jgi:hypothetical protein
MTADKIERDPQVEEARERLQEIATKLCTRIDPLHPDRPAGRRQQLPGHRHGALGRTDRQGRCGQVSARTGIRA